MSRHKPRWRNKPKESAGWARALGESSLAGCKKHPFPTKVDAKAEIARAKSNGKGLTYPYRCTTCGQWHMTSQPREMRQEYARRKAAYQQRNVKDE